MAGADKPREKQSAARPKSAQPPQKERAAQPQRKKGEANRAAPEREKTQPAAQKAPKPRAKAQPRPEEEDVGLPLISRRVPAQKFASFEEYMKSRGGPGAPIEGEEE